MSNSQVKVELQAALEQVTRCLNAMGGESQKQEAVKEFLRYQHRTLQQSFMRVVIMPSLEQLNTQFETGFYDMRNQASVDMAHKMISSLPESERYIPFV